MKSLLLLRHAKSSWSSADVPDHARRLNRRGIRDAPRMGRLLVREGFRPDVIFSSTAVRAHTTACEVIKAAGWDIEARLADELYQAEPQQIVQVLRGAEEAAVCILVVAHNPGLEQLVALLSHDAHAMPTAALAALELDIPRWDRMGLSVRATRVQIWRPRELSD